MTKGNDTAITPTRAQDFSEWYQQVIRAADMAENSEVRGCMVIKPWGYGIWENIQQQLDSRFKATGHKNAYFPLLIPLSYLEKEAQHAEGFATECAVVTHHRLETQIDENGKTRLIPAGQLAEPFVIRPTSETIIGAAFARWVQSYRDLPLLINQWANVMRWEMRPRLFLRTAEFLWQEGHTAHETQAEAEAETATIHNLYTDFLQDVLAIPVIPGEKTERERFPGAETTLTVEAMVQDRKAIQAGTSHYLGQNFSQAAGIEFVGRNNSKELAHTTSWGVSTRLIGTLIMTHGDDDGLILPPRISPEQIVIIPFTPKEDTRAEVIDACQALASTLRANTWRNLPIRVHVDDRDIGPGTKSWEWIKKGVPLRIEIGPKEITSRKLVVMRRDRPHKEKTTPAKEDFIRNLDEILEEIQNYLYQRALTFREEHTIRLNSLEQFHKFFDENSPGGFAACHWAGTKEEEEVFAKETKTTVRCIPHDPQFTEEGPCILTGRPSSRRVIFARAY